MDPPPAPPAPPAPGAPAGVTLVIQTAFLGDVILSLPLLAALASRHGLVDVVATPAALPLLEGHPAVRRVIAYDKAGRDRGLRAFVRMSRAIRAAGYRRVYLPHRSARSGMLALLARIPERVGFADAPVRWAYTRRVPRDLDRHEAERLLGLAGTPSGPVTFTLGLTDRDRAAAAEWLRAEGIEDEFIALAPGSVWGTKRWPYFPELAARLSLPVVILGGPDIAEVAAQIQAQARGAVASGAGRLSLRQSAAVLERAGVLVCNDSAPLHLGSATGTPTVALFGPTVPAFGFGPLGEDTIIVEHPSLSCRPCSRHGPPTCPLGHHRCMQELEPATVHAAVTRLLATRGGSRGLRPRT